ncbi:MAG TPA: hypothetical protein VIC08_06045 [Cellvibrionaceae bacterium]
MHKNLNIVALATCLVGFSSSSSAETATDTIEVYAGLAPALELSCTDVHFGVWRVPTGNRGGATNITLTRQNDALAGDNAGRMALSENPAFNGPQAGSCNVTGSSATTGNGQAILVGESPQQTVSGTLAAIADVSDYKFGTIAIPGGGAGTMAYTLGVSNRTPPISETGTASFSIVGVLTIPNNITSDWFGGYKSSAPHAVQFDDFVDN